jgi:hypothetical protein
MGGCLCAELSQLLLDSKDGGTSREIDRTKRASVFTIEKEWYLAVAKRL